MLRYCSGTHAAAVFVVLFAISAAIAQDRESISSFLATASTANEQALGRFSKGSGTAICTTARKGVNEKGVQAATNEQYLAEFRFRGEKNRFDGYEWDAATKAKGAHLVSSIDAVEDTMEHLVKKQKVFTYDGGLNWRDRWVLGKDFRPEVSLQPSNEPLMVMLSNAAKNASNVRMTNTEQGLVRIECEWDAKNDWPRYVKATFDPQKGYMLVAFERSAVMGPAGGEMQQNESYEIGWLKYPEGYYPIHMKYTRREKMANWGKEPVPDMTTEYEVAIQEFSPTAAVGDEDFTLQALKLPAGVEVFDSRRNVNYRIGGVDTEEKALRDTLDDMDISAPTALDTNETASAAGAPVAAESASESGSSSGPAGSSSRVAVATGTYKIVGIGLLAIAVIAIILRLWVRKRERS